MSSLEDFLFISFEQKNERKKGSTLMEFKYLLFCASIDLLDVKDFKRNLEDGNLRLSVKSRNGELGNRMRGMMGTLVIRVETRVIRV